jgi:hypothetical protein
MQRIHPAGGNLRQPMGDSHLTVLPIHLQQLGDRRVRSGGTLGRRPVPAQPLGDGGPDPGQAPASESHETGQPPIPCSGLQFLQCLDRELAVQPLGQLGADPGHRAKRGQRLPALPQPLLDRHPAGLDVVPDRRGQASTDGGQAFQSLGTLVPKDRSHRAAHPS